MALPRRTFYLYECDGRGRPVRFLCERSSRTSAEAVSRYLYRLRLDGATTDYLRLKENVVALAAMIGKTAPARPSLTVVKPSPSPSPARPAQLNLW